MFSITQSNAQVYSVFGSFVVEQHETEHRNGTLIGSRARMWFTEVATRWPDGH